MNENNHYEYDYEKVVKEIEEAVTKLDLSEEINYNDLNHLQLDFDNTISKSQDEVVNFETQTLSNSFTELKTNFANLISPPTLKAAQTKVKIFFVNLAHAVVTSANALLRRVSNKLHEYPYQNKLNQAVNSIKDYGHQPLPATRFPQNIPPVKPSFAEELCQAVEYGVDTIKSNHSRGMQPHTYMYGNELNHPPPSQIIENLRQSNVRIKPQAAQKPAKLVKKSSTSRVSKKSKTANKAK